MAHTVFRRSVTAGIAFAGAGAIALSTLPVLPSDHTTPRAAVTYVEPVAPRVMTTEVEYVALVNSLEILVAGATAALQESFGAFSNQMPALFRQVGAQWADPDLLPLNHSLIAAAVFTPIAPLVVGPFTHAVAEVLAQTFPSRGDEIRENLPQAVEYAFARLIGPIISAIGATGAVHQEIYNAGMAGDSPGQWLAILRSPFTVIDGFLNGGYGDISTLLTGEVGGERIAAPGLLTPWGQYPVDRSVTEEAEPEAGETALRSGTDTAATLVADEVADVPDVVEAGDESAAPAAEETTVVTPASDEVTDTADGTAEAEAPKDADTSAEAEKAESGTKVRGASATKADKQEKADTQEAAGKSENAEKPDTSAKADKSDGSDSGE